MSSVAEIELAIERLPLKEKLRLLDSLGRTVGKQENARSSMSKTHSVLDIPTVNVGRILQADLSRDALLDEMLEDRL